MWRSVIELDLAVAVGSRVVLDSEADPLVVVRIGVGAERCLAVVAVASLGAAVRFGRIGRLQARPGTRFNCFARLRGGRVSTVMVVRDRYHWPRRLDDFRLGIAPDADGILRPEADPGSVA